MKTVFKVLIKYQSLTVYLKMVLFLGCMMISTLESPVIQFISYIYTYVYIYSEKSQLIISADAENAFNKTQHIFTI